MMLKLSELFTPTNTRCKCGLSFLEKINGLTVCPVCGFYSVNGKENTPPPKKREVYLDDKTGKFTFNPITNQ